MACDHITQKVARCIQGLLGFRPTNKNESIQITNNSAKQNSVLNQIYKEVPLKWDTKWRKGKHWPNSGASFGIAKRPPKLVSKAYELLNKYINSNYPASAQLRGYNLYAASFIILHYIDMHESISGLGLNISRKIEIRALCLRINVSHQMWFKHLPDQQMQKQLDKWK